MDAAYVQGASLSRAVTTEDRMRMDATMKTLTSANDSIDVANLDLEERYNVGIDLEEALANPGSDADIVLEEGDIIFVPEYKNTVKISGNVLYANTVTYDSKMSVKDYIRMAGGYGYQSKKTRTYIVYMNGTVGKARKLNKKSIQPGCEIIVPQKRQGKNNLQDILAVSTTSASIATMIATIGNIVK
jgi:protein involved in polysaccharide export with SLBB domain